jgi:hypothetical protein
VGSLLAHYWLGYYLKDSDPNQAIQEFQAALEGHDADCGLQLGLLLDPEQEAERAFVSHFSSPNVCRRIQQALCLTFNW